MKTDTAPRRKKQNTKTFNNKSKNVSGKAKHQKVEDKGEGLHVDSGLTVNEAAPPSKKENTLTSNNKSGNVESSDCQFVRSSKRATPVPKHGRFVLDEQDIKTIVSGEWLTDHIIGAAHSVLRKQFPQAN